MGFNSINKGPSHYGLALILGGAACSLWELCSAYYLLAKKLNNEVVVPIGFLKNDKLNSSNQVTSKGNLIQNLIF